MELIRGLHNLRPRHRGCVATIGAFDGVHRGHQKLFERLIAKGRDLQLPATAVIFEPLPREFFAPREAPARLMSFREKLRALEAVGLDRVLCVSFNDRLSHWPALTFIEKVFVEGLGARFIVVGDDFHFGHNREGDIDFLRRTVQPHGFQVAGTETFTHAGERISSTRIRQALENEDFAGAEQMLGRPFSIAGKVVMGKQLGRQLGVPTANLQLHRLRAPIAGVYAVEVAGLGCALQPGVANVGTRPTVGDLTKAILEVHLLDFDRDIYGERIEVIFRKKLRDEQQFDSLDALKQQISDDIEQGRHFFQR